MITDDGIADGVHQSFQLEINAKTERTGADSSEVCG